MNRLLVSKRGGVTAELRALRAEQEWRHGAGHLQGLPGGRQGVRLQRGRGADQLLLGGGLGLLGACEGEERRIVLGPSLAWGARGVGDRIPGNATVVIDVKVDKVERDLKWNF